MRLSTAKLAVMVVLLQQQAPNVRQPQSGTVTGILRTSSGMPLEGQPVSVEPVDSAIGEAVLVSIGLTDSAGRYVLGNVSPGRYRIATGRIGVAPLYHPGVAAAERATTITVVAGQTTEVVDMVFKRLRLSGRVVDINTGQGRRIDSLTLCCSESSTPSVASIVISSRTLRKSEVAADGTFGFDEIAPGDYFLHAASGGIVTMALPISLDSDAAGLEVRVGAGVELRGRILDRLRSPVVSVSLSLKPDPKNAFVEIAGMPDMSGSEIGIGGTSSSPGTAMLNLLRTSTRPRAAVSSAEGTFAFAGVLPGKYVLEVNAPGGGNGFRREIEVGAFEPVEASLDVPFTQVTGQIVAAGGKALPPFSGSVRFVSSDENARILFGFPDEAGNFSLLITPGEYRLFTETLNVDRSIQSISDGSVDLQKQPFVVDGTRHHEVRITIDP